MMKDLGHEVILYASEENEAPCDELVTVVTRDEQQAMFGDYDHRQRFFKIDWNTDALCWRVTNERAIIEIGQRAEREDFICLIAGVCQKPIADAFPAHIPVEFGIGYRGVFSKFKVFESYAWMHYIYGKQGTDDGNWFDTVIPNYFDPDDFPYSPVKDDYYLYIGRLVARKGVQIAVDVTQRIGAKLLLAGQGVVSHEPGRVTFEEGTVTGDHIEYVGFADLQRRGELMSRAKAVFVPTAYIEPFGGVSIEAMMCGTPVIASDFGAFPENVINGVSGYRFRSEGEAVWAAQHVHELDPQAIRNYALANFSLGRVKWLYQAYFEQLLTLWEKGWYSSHDAGVSQYHRYDRAIPTVRPPLSAYEGVRA